MNASESNREYLQTHNIAALLDGLVKDLCKEKPANPKAWMAERLASGGQEPSLSTGLRTHSCGELRIENAGQTVTIAGWVQKARDQKGLVFVDVRDRYGITQCVFGGNLYEEAKKLGREWVIQVTGKVAEREVKYQSKKDDAKALATGDIEIFPTEWKVLGESKQPPMKIEDKCDAKEDVRLQYRYLDLRRNPVKDALMLRNQITIAVRKALNGLKFCEVETPILIKSTPEGARDFVVPSRENPGKFYALPQSPQTFKQLIMVGGMDRYFQLCKCFRDEGTVIAQGRQPEFTQVDCEMSFVTQDDVLATFESVMTDIIRDTTGIQLPKFQQMSFDVALRDYGIDKPDMRFDMKLANLTGAVQPCPAFPKFDTAEHVVALCLQEKYFEMSKKDLDKALDRKKLEPVDELFKLADKQEVGSGIFWVKVESVKGKKFDSPLAKNFSQEQFAQWAELCQATDKSVMVLLAGPNKHQETQMCMGKLRHHFGSELGYRSSGISALWVVDFPLLEWDEDEQRCVAMHHPFTSPSESSLKAFMTVDPKGDPKPLEDIRSNAYDMVINGTEAGGGSIRITSPEVQARMFELLNMSKEEYTERFGFLMDAFTFGAPPHGGLAFGLDRLCTILGEAVGIPQQLDAPLKSIRNYMAFPKTKGGMDAMIKAPCALPQEQLGELYITSTAPAVEESSEGGAAAALGDVDEGRMEEIRVQLEKLQAEEPPNPRGKPSPEQVAALQKHSTNRQAVQSTMSEAEIAIAIDRGWYAKDFSKKAGKDKKKDKKKDKAAPAAAQAAPKPKGEAKPKEEKKKKEKKEKEPSAEEVAKAAAKKLKAAVKEGGKKGVELEGASDMGGMRFFCTTLQEPDGDMELLEKAFEAMNAKPPEDPEEERRGGAGHIGKMVFSAGPEFLQIVVNMPEDLQAEGRELNGKPCKPMRADEWLRVVLAKNEREAQGVKIDPSSNASFAKASVPANKDLGIFPLKIKDDFMSSGFGTLRENNCVPDKDESSDAVVYGDFEDDY